MQCESDLTPSKTTIMFFQYTSLSLLLIILSIIYFHFFFLNHVQSFLTTFFSLYIFASPKTTTSTLTKATKLIFPLGTVPPAITMLLVTQTGTTSWNKDWYNNLNTKFPKKTNFLSESFLITDCNDNDSYNNIADLYVHPADQENLTNWSMADG